MMYYLIYQLQKISKYGLLLICTLCKALKAIIIIICTEILYGSWLQLLHYEHQAEYNNRYQTLGPTMSVLLLHNHRDIISATDIFAWNISDSADSCNIKHCRHMQRLLVTSIYIAIVHPVCIIISNRQQTVVSNSVLFFRLFICRRLTATQA